MGIFDKDVVVRGEESLGKRSYSYGLLQYRNPLDLDICKQNRALKTYYLIEKQQICPIKILHSAS